MRESDTNRTHTADTEEVRTIGYLCPACGKGVMSNRDRFTLSSSDAAVSCSCGGSIFHSRYDGQRYRLDVPCGLCGQIHTAYCPPERMLSGGTALGCAKSGQFCCFIGPEGIVEKHLRDLEILSEKERQGGGLDAFADNIIMYEILSELRDIAARPDGIMCRCGSRGYTMQIRRAAVDLICRDCGGRLRIPAASDRDLDDLCCHMTLLIPGKSPEEA